MFLLEFSYCRFSSPDLSRRMFLALSIPVAQHRYTRNYAYLMDHNEDLQLACTWPTFIAVVFTLFACAAQLVEDPRFSAKGDDGGMGMVYYVYAR